MSTKSPVKKTWSLINQEGELLATRKTMRSIVQEALTHYGAQPVYIFHNDQRVAEMNTDAGRGLIITNNCMNDVTQEYLAMIQREIVLRNAISGAYKAGDAAVKKLLKPFVFPAHKAPDDPIKRGHYIAYPGQHTKRRRQGAVLKPGSYPLREHGKQGTAEVQDALDVVVTSTRNERDYIVAPVGEPASEIFVTEADMLANEEPRWKVVYDYQGEYLEQPYPMLTQALKFVSKLESTLAKQHISLDRKANTWYNTHTGERVMAIEMLNLKQPTKLPDPF